jgi:hypothetical protein
MDIKCFACGEPWDIDEIYRAKRKGDPDFEFTKQGYAILACPSCINKPERQTEEYTLEKTEVAYLLGDDLDGLASTMEDFEIFMSVANDNC